MNFYLFYQKNILIFAPKYKIINYVICEMLLNLKCINYED
jgi:hypothetical protein